MKARLAVIGATTAVVLAFALGLVAGQSNGAPAVAGMGSLRPFATSGQWSDIWETMDAMHDSPQMRAMHAQMPAEWQARCDALHEQMAGWMGSGMMNGSGAGGMMGGQTSGGMMGGPGMMGW